MNLRTTRRRIPANHPYPRGLTVLELLVTMMIIGVVASLVLPAIGAARESARRITCVSHLREIGLAVQIHHDAAGHLPVGWQFDEQGQSAYGWAVPLLPYIDQPSLHDRIDISQHVGDPAHDEARSTMLELMLCPSDIIERSFVLYEDDDDDDDSAVIPASASALFSSAPLKALLTLPTANYVGVFGTIEPDDDIPVPVGDGSFLENRRVRFGDFQRGLSNTIIIGERTMAQFPSTWLGVDLLGDDAAARLVGATLEGLNNPYADECDFSSRHVGGANFLWADGHVSFVTETIELNLYHQSARRRATGGR